MLSFLYQLGRNATVIISNCNNLPLFIQKDVYSVNTYGSCARLYNQTNCDKKGGFIEVLPRSPSHNDLRNWDFGDKTVSAGPCPDSCSINITGRSIGETLVQIFVQKEFKGNIVYKNYGFVCVQ